MGLLSAIKSALGLSDSAGRAGGTDVTVERESDATNERAVKESDPDEIETAGATEADATSHDETGTTSADSGTAEADSPGGDGSVEGVDESDQKDGESSETDGEPVDEIKGIGPAYADRLAEAGVYTVADLAAADAAELDDATDIGGGRLETWIERAKAR
jgi:predicted flap endonuclease-1-like 5' DNA nuclease